MKNKEERRSLCKRSEKERENTKGVKTNKRATPVGNHMTTKKIPVALFGERDDPADRNTLYAVVIDALEVERDRRGSSAPAHYTRVRAGVHERDAVRAVDATLVPRDAALGELLDGPLGIAALLVVAAEPAWEHVYVRMFGYVADRPFRAAYGLRDCTLSSPPTLAEAAAAQQQEQHQRGDVAPLRVDCPVPPALPGMRPPPECTPDDGGAPSMSLARLSAIAGEYAILLDPDAAVVPSGETWWRDAAKGSTPAEEAMALQFVVVQESRTREGVKEFADRYAALMHRCALADPTFVARTTAAFPAYAACQSRTMFVEAVHARILASATRWYATFMARHAPLVHTLPFIFYDPSLLVADLLCPPSLDIQDTPEA